MATILESFQVDSPEHGRSFKIDLVEGLDSPHLDFIEKEWSPILKRQYDLALLAFFQLPPVERTESKWDETLGAHGAADEHWKWRTKCRVAPGSGRRIFALLNAGDVEATMVALPGKESRLTKPQSLVYVDFVAVAPWNRKEVQKPQRFRHFGSVMIGAAVATSQSLGFDGRCGLHSLPQSEGFYRRIGMSDLGPDPAKDSLRYFEFSHTAATTFKEKGDV